MDHAVADPAVFSPSDRSHFTLQKHRELISMREGESFRLLRWTSTVAAVEVILGRGRTAPVEGHGDHWHYHPAVELTLIEKGSGTRLVADYIDMYHPGDLVLIGPNVPHYWQMRGTSAGLAIQWDFPKEHGIWSLAESTQLRSLIETARRGLQVAGPTRALIRSKMENLVHADGLERLGMFLQIFGELANAPRRDVKLLSDQPFSLSGTAETQEIIRRAVSYILAHYREQVRLHDLLKLTGMSRATFARQFLLHAGKPFSTFRNQVRLQAVCHALCDTSEPVGTIAFEHGFNQLSFFNRLFHREFGINPSAYRRAHFLGKIPLDG